MKRITASILSVLLMLSLVFSSSVFAAEKQSAWDSFKGLFTKNAEITELKADVGVEYRGHVENKGDFPLDGSWIQGPAELGTTGESLRLEGFWLQLTGDDIPADLNLEYRVHVQNVGWMDPVQNGDFAGTEGRGLRIEAIELELVDDDGIQSEDYSVRYTGHVQNRGDVPQNDPDAGMGQLYYEDGGRLGTVGSSLRLEAIEVWIVEKEADLTAYNDLIEDIELLDEADYTPESWANLEAVMAANVMTSDDYQADVDAAVVAIQEAVDALVMVLKVEDVSAINAKQIQVTFTTEVDANSFINSTTKLLANSPMTLTRIPSAINPNNTVNIATMTASLGTDGRTLTLTAAGAEFFEGTYSLTVSDVVKSTTGDKNQVYSGTFVAKDTTPPTIKAVTSSTAGTTASSVKVTFTEPVKAGTAILIDGAYVGVTTAADNITINGLSLAASQSHTLSILNLTDAAGNVTATASQAFTISSDATAPTVASVEQYTDSAVLVTFDKAMDTATLVGTSNIAMTDVNLVGIGAVTISAFDTTSTTTNTKFIVATNSTTLYGLSTTKAIKLGFKDSIKDSLGNKLVATIKDFTLTKDNIQPTVTNVTYETAAGKLTNIVLEFSEPLDTVPVNWTSGDITLVDSNGVDQTAKYFTGASTYTRSTDKKKVSVSVLATSLGDAGFSVMPNSLVKGINTVNVNAGVFKDLAVGANTNAAASKTIDFGQPAAGSFAITQADVTNPSSNVIQVVYPVAVKGGAVAGSATDGANYTVAGKSLAGASITLNVAQTTATITIPSEFVPTSNSASIFTVNNVQNSSGEIITPFNGTVAVVDNVKPVLVSAKQLAYDKVQLTYSEAMDDGTPPIGNVGLEFVIAQDSTILTDFNGTTTGNLTAVIDPNDARNVIVTLVSPTADSTGGAITQSNAASSVLSVDATGSTVTAPTNFVVKVTAIDASDDPTHLAISTDGGLTFSAAQAIAAASALGVDTFAVATSGTTVVGDTYSFTVTPAINAGNNLTIITNTTATPAMKDLAANVQKVNTTVQITQ